VCYLSKQRKTKKQTSLKNKAFYELQNPHTPNKAAYNISQMNRKRPKQQQASENRKTIFDPIEQKAMHPKISKIQ
jgi:hypothetical protein